MKRAQRKAATELDDLYHETSMPMHVAASMGFWTEVGDYCAVRQIAHDGAPMAHDQRPIFARYFNLGGPVVRHSRQSNVWRNLELEAVHAEANDTLWRRIAEYPSRNYETLRKLLPV